MTLKVLFFTSSLGGGGAEKHTLHLANHLDRERYEVALWVARGGGSYVRQLREDVRYGTLGVRMRWAPARLRRVLRGECPDVVCSILDHANIATIVSRIGMIEPPAHVAVVQGSPGAELSGGRRKVLRRVVPVAYRRSEAVVALSEGIGKELGRMGGTLAARTEVIHNAAIEGAVEGRGSMDSCDLREDSGEWVVVCCGRLTGAKGHSYLLRAIQYCRRDLPVRLWIVGEGELRGELEKEAEGLGISEAVDFFGFQEDPYPYIREADAFVLPSLWEGFGNVLVEAMAVGTPVVTTSCPHGPSEIVADEENGLIVQPRDAEALASALVRLLTDQPLRERLSTAGRERAEYFTAPAIADKYGRLFERVAYGFIAEGPG